MDIQSKIVNLKSLEEFALSRKATGKNIILCQGHFNVIHPGHLRFIDFANDLGDNLIVAIQGYNWLEDKNKGVFFDEEERARGVASLAQVDKVIIFNDFSIKEIISAIKPDIYVKGAEFVKQKDSQEDISLVKQYGGKVVFNSGQIKYNTTDYLDCDIDCLGEKNRSLFRAALKRQKIDYSGIIDYVRSFKNQNILVIGDAIVDEYIACDAVGMSAEAPVLNIREIEKKSFVGGAAIVARHIASLGAKSYFISVVGADEPGHFTKNDLEDNGVTTRLILSDERQTTYKIRYMVGKQKVLRVSRFHQHKISALEEEKLFNFIRELAPQLTGIIISDFSYGVISEELCNFITDISAQYNIKVFGDSQSSSQIGDIIKFKNFDLITPTEREARIALGDNYNGLEKIGMTLLDKTLVKNLAITLAERGLIAYQRTKPLSSDDIVIRSQHFPALNVNPIDVMGAGDSLLSGFALSLCSGANLMESSVIASCVASIAVNKIGNIPVQLEELLKYIDTIKQDFYFEDKKEVIWKA